jgi:ATP-dependent DNA ligase
MVSSTPAFPPLLPSRRLGRRVHEIKHDGYRLIVCRDGETVRLFT